MAEKKLTHNGPIPVRIGRELRTELLTLSRRTRIPQQELIRRSLERLFAEVADKGVAILLEPVKE